MKLLLTEIKNCLTCEAYLPDPPKPILSLSQTSKIILIGQAPGRVVHENETPWYDKSGINLRQWMGVTDEQFYDNSTIGIIPMGFCYPGTGKSGDLPPRKECAPQWHQKLFDFLPEEKLIVLIGAYAMKYYLGKKMKKNLTSTVQNYAEYLPNFFVLPHPSPRNNIWMKKNPWFKDIVLPQFEYEIAKRL